MTPWCSKSVKVKVKATLGPRSNCYFGPYFYIYCFYNPLVHKSRSFKVTQGQRSNWHLWPYSNISCSYWPPCAQNWSRSKSISWHRHDPAKIRFGHSDFYFALETGPFNRNIIKDSGRSAEAYQAIVCTKFWPKPRDKIWRTSNFLSPIKDTCHCHNCLEIPRQTFLYKHVLPVS